MPVYKNKKRGTWYTSFYYTNWKGVRKRKKKEGFTRKRMAQLFEKEFLEQNTNQCDIKFDTLVKIYLDDCKLRLKPSTYENRRTIINKFFLNYFKELRINKITPAIVRHWQSDILNNNKDKSPLYLHDINIKLSTIFNFAVKYYNLTSNPVKQCGNIGTTKNKDLNFWTLREYNTFISKLNTDDPFYLIFNILFWTGIRRGELLALSPNDFNLKNSTVYIQKNLVYIGNKGYIGTPKTRKSIRKIFLPKFLCNMIKIFIEKNNIENNTFMFNIKPITLARKLKFYAKEAKIKHIRIHDIRHSHASLLIEQGCSPLIVAERLGHESIQTTLKIYVHLYPNKQIEIAKKLDDLYKNIK